MVDWPGDLYIAGKSNAGFRRRIESVSTLFFYKDAQSYSTSGRHASTQYRKSFSPKYWLREFVLKHRPL